MNDDPIKSIEIFKPGRHTTSSGQQLAFSDRDVLAIASNYDPDLSGAPIVVGHPKTDDPAYGWVSGLDFADGILAARTKDVDADFAALVNKGRFNRVSASFYPPNHKSNPKPGSYYLRHVGFLGAAAPSVKGLKTASFGDDGEGTVEIEFSEESGSVGLLKSIRDLLVGAFSDKSDDFAETKLSILLNRRIDAMNGDRTDIITRMASAAGIDPSTVNQILNGSIATPPDGRLRGFSRVLGISFETLKKALPTDFSEKTEEQKMPDENKDFAEQEAALEKKSADLEARESAHKKEMAEFAESQAKTRSEENADLVDCQIKKGCIAPGIRDGIILFMDGLGASEAVNFVEGDDQTPLDYFRELLTKASPVIDFSEKSKDDGNPDPTSDPDEIARRAVEFQEEERTKGREIDVVTAVRHVLKQENE